MRSLKTRIIFITLVFAIPAFLTGRMIWPPDPAVPDPTSAQLPFFMILSVFESLSFGLGIAFLTLGWPYVKKITGKSRTLSILTFLSIGWYMVNWWPHDNLHIHNGMNLQGLLYIEYGFHVTMIIAAIILAYSFFMLILKAKDK